MFLCPTRDSLQSRRAPSLLQLFREDVCHTTIFIKSSASHQQTNTVPGEYYDKVFELSPYL